MVRNIAWLVFIRAGSKRFPSKCYHPILTRNIFDLLSTSAIEAGIVPKDLFLCTSSSSQNNNLSTQAKLLGHTILRGSENYPIQRICKNWSTLKNYNTIVRICGDSPLYPFRFVNRVITFYESKNFSAITNIRLRNFPSGFSIEVYNKNDLMKCLSEHSNLSYLEHMSSILCSKQYPCNRIVDIRCKQSLDFFHLKRYTVDYISDIKNIEYTIISGHHQYYQEKLAEIDLCFENA